jgi:PAS domain S-box-containing protein
MAVTLKEGHAVRGVEAVVERPDGTRVPFRPYPTPLKDASGRVIGALNVLIDLSEQKADEARLAAIVTSSDDAIISKTLDGMVTSWNTGATRIFGYQPEEMIGQSILRLIPPELHDEEKQILAKLRRGERIDHYETERVTKDGRRINLSLTVIAARPGNLIGAWKVARDITGRKCRVLQQPDDELNHRVRTRWQRCSYRQAVIGSCQEPRRFRVQLCGPRSGLGKSPPC